MAQATERTSATAPAPTMSTQPTPSAQSTASGAAGGTTPFVPDPVAAAATCVTVPGLDSAGNTFTYEPDKAIDGSPDTAWRCDGDASGQMLTVDFGTPVHLTSVSLIPGFDKIDPTDGTDRFEQGRRISRAQWTFDNGTTVEAVPGTGRASASTPVDVTTTTVRLTILATVPGTAVVNNAGQRFDAVDKTAVSEVSFTGVR